MSVGDGGHKFKVLFSKDEHKSCKMNGLELQKHLMFECPSNFRCLPCGLVFESKADYINHLRISCGEVEVKCDTC